MPALSHCRRRVCTAFAQRLAFAHTHVIGIGMQCVRTRMRISMWHALACARHASCSIKPGRCRSPFSHILMVGLCAHSAATLIMPVSTYMPVSIGMWRMHSWMLTCMRIHSACTSVPRLIGRLARGLVFGMVRGQRVASVPGPVAQSQTRPFA